jgi:predicted phosphatase
MTVKELRDLLTEYPDDGIITVYSQRLVIKPVPVKVKVLGEIIIKSRENATKKKVPFAITRTEEMVKMYKDVGSIKKVADAFGMSYSGTNALLRRAEAK